MSIAFVIAMVWVIAGACCMIMKKIQPEFLKLYLVYVITICILLTCFLAWYLLKAQPVLQTMQ